MMLPRDSKAPSHSSSIPARLLSIFALSLLRCGGGIGLDTCALGLRSHHGTYIVCSADDQPGQGYRLMASPEGGQHIFQVERFDGGQFAFKGHNGMYMSASPGYVKQEPHRLEWELFTHEITSDGLSAFLSAHDMYLSVSLPQPFGLLSQVSAMTPNTTTRPLTHDMSRTRPSVAVPSKLLFSPFSQASRFDEWEKLRLRAAGNGRFHLISVHGDLLTAQPSELPCSPSQARGNHLSPISYLISQFSSHSSLFSILNSQFALLRPLLSLFSPLPLTIPLTPPLPPHPLSLSPSSPPPSAPSSPHPSPLPFPLPPKFLPLTAAVQAGAGLWTSLGLTGPAQSTNA